LSCATWFFLQVANASIEQMVGGGRVGDVRILPQPVLGCPTAVFHAADPLPYVYHMFMGSWKISQPSGLKVFLRKLSSTLHRPQQLKEHKPSAAAGAGAAVPARVAAAAVQASLHPSKPPRRPILEEQIMQHMSQQQKQQHRKGLQAQHLHPQPHQQQGARPTVAGAVQMTAAEQQPLQQAKQQQQAGAAAAANKLPARKLRASQAQLVRPVPVPNMVQGLLMEPEVPSRILSGMPTLSLLVIAALLVTLYKRQRGACAGGLLATARDSVRAVRGAVGLPPRSSLTRPHSRSHLSTGPNGNALLVCTTVLPLPSAAAVGAAGGGVSKGGLPPVQEAVCYSSSQHAARGHGHKRSWGSTSSFQL
jgi:hypothetical protein